MSTVLEWTGKPISENGITECQFRLENDNRTIPGILWVPMQYEQPLPLVLMGHGGSGHKRAERQVLLGRRFAGTSQIAAVSIDGPFHGDRVTTHLEARGHAELMTGASVNKVIDDMIDDWRTTLEVISQLDFINSNCTAYLGLSMGTRFGLPFVSAAGSQMSCAVLGKNGMHAPAGINNATRFRQDAPRISVPVLFHVQWDDELFPRDGQFELFDLLGTQDKQLIAFPGSHRDTAPAAIDAWCGFITQHFFRS